MRKDPKERKAQILETAVNVCKTKGFHSITREDIAIELQITKALISRYFGTMANLKRDIIRFAIRNEVIPVIAQGLATGDRHAKKAPEDLKQRAAAYLAQQ